MSQYSWLLFDADGTLFDYELAESSALKNVFEHFGFPFKPEYGDAYRIFNSRVWEEFELGLIDQESLRTRRFAELFQSLNMETDIELFSTKYLEFLSHSTQLMDGIEDVLTALRPTYRMAILTNGLKDVQRPRFRESSIGSFFEAWIISEEVGFAKPDPRIFDVVFEKIGNPPFEEVLMIGDSLSSDITGGINYGIDTCWYNPTSLPAPHEMDIHYEISEISQLLDFL
jgi:YjjG family noncanonical pyrimidine nucleotidase